MSDIEAIGRGPDQNPRGPFSHVVWIVRSVADFVENFLGDDWNVAKARSERLANPVTLMTIGRHYED